MSFAFYYPKDIQNFFWKTIDFVKNLEITQIAGGGGLCSLRHYDAMRTKTDMCFIPNGNKIWMNEACVLQMCS